MHFRRQHAIGPYIADFCAPGAKLVIEVDGSQHLDQEEYDLERTAFLVEKGFRVLRFWNSDVINKIDDVMGVIYRRFGLYRWWLIFMLRIYFFISLVSSNQEGDECLDFGCAHLGKMAFVVKEDETRDPVHVSLFGAVGIVFGAYSVTHLIEEFLSLRRDGRRVCLHIVPFIEDCYTVSNSSRIFISCRLTS